MNDTSQGNIPLIYTLIPKVMAEVKEIRKNRSHSQGYAYRGVEDYLNAFRPALLAHGVFVVPQVLERLAKEKVTQKDNGKTTVQEYVSVRMSFTFFAPDGSSIQAITVGDDVNSADGGSMNAQLAAFKTAFEQVFCVPTGPDQPGGQPNHERRNQDRRQSRNHNSGSHRPAPAAQSRQVSAAAPATTSNAPTAPQDLQNPDDLAAAQEAAHREVEGELKQIYLDSGKDETQWNAYYNQHDLADQSLPDKRRMLAAWREKLDQHQQTPQKLALDLQAPALTPNQQAIKTQIAELEGLGVPKDGDNGWSARMARLAAGICEVEHLDPAAAAKVRASFVNWIKERKAPNVRELKRPA